MVAFEQDINPYLGGQMVTNCSAETNAKIDKMVVELIQTQYDKAKQILSDNMAKLHELAKHLYEKETLTGDEFMEILASPPKQAAITTGTTESLL